MVVKNIVLGIGIFIVYLLVLNYGIEAFYPSPQYDQVCAGRNYYYLDPYTKPVSAGVNCTVSPTIQQQDQCVQQGGNLVASSYDEFGCPSSFECDLCQKELSDAQKEHSKVVFIISLIAGILTLLIGYLFLSTEPVGSALMASGVGALVYGSITNWQNLSSVWRFVLLLLALVLLIWIALRINTKKKGLWQKLGLRK